MKKTITSPYEVVHGLPFSRKYTYTNFEKEINICHSYKYILALVSNLLCFQLYRLFSPMLSIISSVKSVSSTSENSPNSSAYIFLIAFHSHTIHQLKVYNLVSLVYSQNCTTITIINLEHFHHP